MIIQHNIPALNSYNKLTINNSSVSKNLQKLSSGYRINSAADDAAGLAISEKMRSQITGLDRAKLNAQDGISLVQTAEGALTEVHSMLNRLVELGTESANGTIQASDRQKIQDEVDALTDEIDRISEATNFNGIKLLDGSLSNGSTSSATSGTKVVTVSSDIAALKTDQQDTAAVSGVYAADFSGITGATSLGATDAIEFTVKYTDANGQSKEITLKTTAAGAGATDGAVASAISDAINADEDLKKLFTVAANGTNANVLEFTSTQAGTAGAKIDGISLGKVVHVSTGVAGTGTLNSSNVSVTTKTAAADKTTKDVIEFNVGGNAVTTGSAQIAGGHTITVGDKTYEIVATGGDVTKVGKGNIAVNAGATDQDTLKNLVSALQANGVSSATVDTSGGANSIVVKIGDLEEIKAVEKKADIMSTSNGVKVSDAAATKNVTKFSVDGAASGFGGKDAYVELGYLDEKGEQQTIKVKYTADATDTTNASHISTAIAADEKLSKLFSVQVVNGNQIELTSLTAGKDGAKLNSVKTTDPNAPSVGSLQTTTLGRDKGQTISIDSSKIANGDTLTVNGKTFQFVEADKMDTVADGNIGVLIDSGSSVNTAANLNLAFKQNGVSLEYNAGTNSFYLGEDVKASGTGGLTLQIGDTADDFNKVTVSVDNMSSTGLGVAGLQVTDQGLSADSIEKVNAAIEKVSVNRGRLGALQNRLEHTINNLSTTSENMTSAESRIRDTDMAKEMMAFTKNNVLVQAAQSMLAQANQQPQQVLQLLR